MASKRACARTLAGTAAAIAWLALATGCPKNVSQTANSGKDYRDKGAKKIELEDGEGKSRDIVTYPGGDRVDWKMFELPEGKKGTLRLKLKWRPPRPGGDLAFDVYNEWFERVERVKPTPGKSDRSKRAKIRNASGKYFVMIYAPRRSDAGKYTFTVRFKEGKQIAVPTAEELADQIRDPPTLPAVFEPAEPVVKTPEQIAAEEAEKARIEEEQRKAKEDADAAAARDAELNKPVYAKVRRTQNASGGQVIITMSKGKNQGIARGWNGEVLRGSSDAAMAGGEFTVIRVTPNECVGKVNLSSDQIRANPRVRLTRNRE
jgi:hypothetical protein